ncbi:hypothetical protein [Nitrosomonas sp.]|uniref:hypothetical protein n=1 Tax=Nitrosomonas sp. TaxID=42353 RepID=UPI00374C9E61
MSKTQSIVFSVVSKATGNYKFIHGCAIPTTHSKYFTKIYFLTPAIASTSRITINVLALLPVALLNTNLVFTQKIYFSGYSGELPFILIQSGIFLPKYRGVHHEINDDIDYWVDFYGIVGLLQYRSNPISKHTLFIYGEKGG